MTGTHICTHTGMASFGIGALSCTLLAIGLLAAFRLVRRTFGSRRAAAAEVPLFPRLHFKIMLVPGSIAGCCWVLGNLFTTLAIVRGGNAVVVAQEVSAQLVTAGLWGIFYYRELTGEPAVFWGLAACFTLVMMVLLGTEKE